MNAPALKMKTLDDIMLDMSVLYESVSNGTTELKPAAELANIAGKYLKAYQLSLARDIFQSHLGRKVGEDASLLKLVNDKDKDS